MTPDELRQLLRANTPRARLEWHVAYWKGKENPRADELLNSVSRWIDTAPNKALLGLKELEKHVEIERGNRPRKAGGKTTAEIRQRAKSDNIEKAARLYETLWDRSNWATIIANRLKVSPSTVREYLPKSTRDCLKTKTPRR